jgi:hypothetical protein
MLRLDMLLAKADREERLHQRVASRQARKVPNIIRREVEALSGLENANEIHLSPSRTAQCTEKLKKANVGTYSAMLSQYVRYKSLRF